MTIAIFTSLVDMLQICPEPEALLRIVAGFIPIDVAVVVFIPVAQDQDTTALALVDRAYIFSLGIACVYSPVRSLVAWIVNVQPLRPSVSLQYQVDGVNVPVSAWVVY
jgi:hypothetical protein